MILIYILRHFHNWPNFRQSVLIRMRVVVSLHVMDKGLCINHDDWGSYLIFKLTSPKICHFLYISKVAYPKADAVNGDVRTVMYNRPRSFIMSPKTAKQMTPGRNFQSIVTAIYVSYACVQFDKYNFRLLSKCPYLPAAKTTESQVRVGIVSFEYTCETLIFASSML